MLRSSSVCLVTCKLMWNCKCRLKTEAIGKILLKDELNLTSSRDCENGQQAGLGGNSLPYDPQPVARDQMTSHYIWFTTVSPAPSLLSWRFPASAVLDVQRTRQEAEF